MPEHKFELCLLKNGGVVSYSLVGAGSRKAIFFHGHPGSRHQVQFIENYCAEEDLEVLSFDRPGYGNSSPQERSKNFLDLSEHIAALADSQGWKKFHLIAVSGGVPFALNCAATLKKRVLSAQLVCGLGPLHEREVRTHFSSRLYHVMKLARWMPSPC